LAVSKLPFMRRLTYRRTVAVGNRPATNCNGHTLVDTSTIAVEKLVTTYSAVARGSIIALTTAAARLSVCAQPPQRYPITTNLSRCGPAAHPFSLSPARRGWPQQPLFEHDLFRKPVSTPGSSPRASFFGIML